MWQQGLLPGPVCLIDIDQENFFGSLEWGTIRTTVADVLPKRGAALAWEHEKPTKIWRLGASPFEAARGTGQGDVDAPTEAGLAQGSVTRGARKKLYCINRAQISGAGPLPCSETDIETIRAIDEWLKSEDVAAPREQDRQGEQADGRVVPR